jgi:mRNA-degrading endonuclease RelE of RelBE toxin-antitoxin system
LEGLRSARRGAYRVIYEIEEAEHVVIVHRIDHRATAYRPR